MLSAILDDTVPGTNILGQLYERDEIFFIQSLIAAYLENHSGAGTRRKHLTRISQGLRSKRAECERNNAYQRIHLQLLKFCLPDVGELHALYDENAPVVQKVFRSYLELGAKRKCGLSPTCHLHRVGSLVHACGFDEERSRHYSTVAAIHDVLEDFFVPELSDDFNVVIRKSYESLLDEYVPHSFRDSLLLLTNHYDMILSFMNRYFKKTGKVFSLKAVSECLADLLINECCLAEYIAEIQEIAVALESHNDIYRILKWKCYHDLYIRRMAKISKQNNDLRAYEIKSVDLFDNFQDREALDSNGRIRNILKMHTWASRGFDLGTGWGPLDERIIEVLDLALTESEDLVVHHFMQAVYCLDHVSTGLNKIGMLKPIFFKG